MCTSLQVCQWCNMLYDSPAVLSWRCNYVINKMQGKTVCMTKELAHKDDVEAPDSADHLSVCSMTACMAKRCRFRLSLSNAVPIACSQRFIHSVLYHTQRRLEVSLLS